MVSSSFRGVPRVKLLCALVASCFAAEGLANPTGPAVVSGTASFNTVGKTLTVTNTPNAIINWRGFSIGAGEATRFQQQSASSSVLNRIVGQDPSVILGTLWSNGRVFLVNPNGVLFGQGSRVDVAGLVASTLNITDPDFLAGRLNFQAGAIAGSIVNQGEIVSASGGRIYLIAPDVQNHGLISSPSGEVVLAAGQSVNLVDADVPNLKVEVQAGGEALNVGRILAEGGKAGIYAGLINQRGIVRADSVSRDATGRIVFRASDTTILDAGSVTSAAGAQGGEIQILGNRVGLVGNARVDASGETGGGTVLVGGDFQGRNAQITNAYRTYVGPDATIKADAITSGDGGRVIVWSDDATRAYGSISARGGAQSGNGGFVEVSGKRWLDFVGRVDTSAPNGASGTLLLDPMDVTVVSGSAVYPGSGNPGFDQGSPDVFKGTTVSTSTLTWGTIDTALAGNNVQVTTFSPSGTGSGSILISNPHSYSSSNHLTFLAHGDITFNGSITNSGSGWILGFAGWDGTLPGGGSIGTVNGVGNISVNQPLSAGGVRLVGGNVVTVGANVSGVDLVEISSNGGQLTVNAGVSVQSANGVSLFADQLTLAGSQVTGGAITIRNTQVGGGDITLGSTVGGTLSLLQGDIDAITVTGGGTLTIGDPLFTDNIDIAGSGVTFTPAKVPALSLVAASSIGQAPGAVLTVGNLKVVAGSAVGLDQADNMIDVIAGSAVESSNTDFRVRNGKSLAVGTVDGTSGIATDAGDGNSIIDINVTSGSLTIDQPVLANFGDSPAAITLTAAGLVNVKANVTSTNSSAPVRIIGGSITIDNGATVSSVYTQGDTSVQLTANNGGIIVQGGGVVAATSGDGGAASVTMTVTAADSGITVSNGTIQATGGNGSPGFDFAFGTDGGAGGAASIALTAGPKVSGTPDINLSSATISATGGTGGAGFTFPTTSVNGGLGGNGGSATIQLNSSNDISSLGHAITATAGAGGAGGSTLVNLALGGAGGAGGTAAISLIASSQVALNSAGPNTTTAIAGAGGSSGDSLSGIFTGVTGGAAGNATITVQAGTDVSMSSASLEAIAAAGGAGGNATVQGANGADGIATVSLTATAGSIQDTDGASLLTARSPATHQVQLSAATGIGQSGQPIRIDGNNLAGTPPKVQASNTSSGSIFLSQTNQTVDLGADWTVSNAAVGGTIDITAEDAGLPASGDITDGLLTFSVTSPLTLRVLNPTKGIFLQSISTFSAPDITLIADNMGISGAVTATGGGTVRLQPLTPSRPIVIELAGTTTGLNLQPFELQNITAGTIEIGRSTDTGTLTVDTALNSTTVTAGTLKLANQDVVINQPINLTNANLVLASGAGGGVSLNADLSVGTGSIDASTSIVNPTGTRTITSSNPGTGFSAGTLDIDTSTTTLNANSSIDTLILASGGQLGGSGTVTVNNTMTWTGGDLSGPDTGKLVVGSAATLTVSGAARTIFAGYDIDNLGTVSLTHSGTVSVSTSGQTVITNSGTWNANQTAVFGDEISSGSFRFVNDASGTVIRNVSGTGTILNLRNDGLLHVQAGTLSIDNRGAFTSTGTFTIDSGATLQFVNSSHTIGGTGTFAVGTGAGTLALNSTTFNIGADVSIDDTVQVTGSNFNVNSGFTATLGTLMLNGVPTPTTLNGPGSLVVTNGLVTTGGSSFGTPFFNLSITQPVGDLNTSAFSATNSLSLTASGGQVNVDAPISQPGSATLSGASGVNVNSSITAGGNMLLDATGPSADVNIAANISKTSGSDATLEVRAGRDILVSSGVAISSNFNMLNVILNSDRNATGGGRISMASGSSITSNGGSVTLGGGADPLASPAVGGTATDGVLLNNTNISAGAGSISIRGEGQAGTTGADGVSMFSGSVLQTTTGAISVTGTGGSAGTAGANIGIRMDNAGTRISTVDGAIALSGDGGTTTGTGGQNRGIQVLSGSVIEATGSGTIAMTGTGGTSVDTGGNNGIFIDDPSALGTRISAVDGSISLTGFGGTTTGTTGAGGFGNRGLNIQENVIVESTGLATITLDGRGGTAVDTPSGFASEGVAILTSSSVRSSSGAISITGVGGNTSTTGGESDGIVLFSGGVVESTGSATITMTGTGGNTGDGSSADGITVDGTAGSRVSSVNGAIVLVGTGGSTAGSGGNNRGINILSGGVVESTGSAPITMTGTGGTSIDTGNNQGIRVSGTGSKVSSASGAITLVGTGDGAGSGNSGVLIEPSGVIESTTSGPISITGVGSNVAGATSSRGIHLSGTGTTGGAISAAGTLTMTGTGGQGSGSSNTGVATDSGTTITSTGSGALFITGFGGDSPGGGNEGIILFGTVTSSVGAITIDGTGRGTGGVGDGVRIFGLVESTSSAPISITGIGTPGGSGDSWGVWVGSPVRSSNGPIVLTGTGGQGGGSNYGIYVDGTVESTGTGTISMTGLGGNSADPDGSNYGLYVSGGTVRAATGAMNLSGTGQGAGPDNRGVVVDFGATVEATSSAPITIVGTGASAGDGIRITDSGTSVSTLGGALALTATNDLVINGGSVTVSTSSGSQSLSSTGNILVTANGGNVSVSSGGTQTVSAGGNLTLTGGTGTGEFAHLTSTGNQTIDVTGGNVSVVANAGGASILSTANQELTLQGPGANALTVGSATSAEQSLIRGNNQVVTAGTGAELGSITVHGGTGAGKNASISNLSGTQSVSTTGTITLTGGTATGTASTCNPAQSGSCAEIVSNAPALQTVSANRIELFGGSGGVANIANIRNNVGTTQLDVGSGGLHLQAGGGVSDNSASIGSGINNAQTITVNVLGDTTLVGGSTPGSGSLIGVGGTGDAQTVTVDFNGTGNLTLTGGSGPNGSAIGAGATATNTTTNLTIDAANIMLNAGSGSGSRFGHSAANPGGGDIVVTATGTLALNSSGPGLGTAIRTLGNVTLNAASIIQGPDSVIASGGTTALSATGNINLPGANDFTGAVSLTHSGTGNVAINAANAIALGASSVGSGELTISAGGTITQTGPIVQAAGAGQATFQSTAGAAITLTNAGNDFTGPVDLDTAASAAITDANSFIIQGGGGAGPAPSSLTINANGTVSQSAAFTGVAPAVVVINAGSGPILLNDPANSFNGNTSVAANTTGAASLVNNDPGGIHLATSSVGGALSLTSGGPITQSGAVAVGGTSSINAGSNPITLTNASNNFTGAVSLSGSTVAITDANALALGTVGSSSLDVTAGGSITQAGPATVSGVSSFAAGANPITLTNTSNDFGGAVGLAGSSASITDSGALVLGTVSLGGGSLSVNSSGAITQTGAIVAGTSSFNAGSNPMTLTNAANDFTGPVSLTGTVVSITDANTLTLGAVNVSSLTVNALGLGQDASGVVVSGTATLNADSINLTSATNDFATVVATSSGPVGLTDANAIDLGATSAASLDVAAGGAVTQSGPINTGAANFNAGANPITLTHASNDFTGAVDLTGTVVSITDVNALTLGAVSATTLTVTTGGAITQSGAIAAGASSFDAGSNPITLTNASNDFTGAVSLSGSAVAIKDANALTLGAVSAADLTVDAGTIGQNASGVVVGGTANLSANSIALATGTNDFGTVNVTSPGNVSLTDANSISIGNVAVGGTFDIAASSTSFLNGFSANNYSFSGGSYTLATGTYNFGGTTTVSGSASVTASGATLNAAGGTINVSGAFTAFGGTVIVGTLNVLAGGLLSGTGTITGNVNNSAGTVSPGASPGILTITGNYVQGPSGILEMQIGGLTPGLYDQLAVGGSASLGGTLNTALINGFVPPPGSTYTLVNALGGVSGTFSTINQPPSTLFNNFYGPTTFDFVAAGGGTAVPAPIAPTFNYTVTTTEQLSQPLIDLIDTIVVTYIVPAVTVTPEGQIVPKPPACN